MNETSKMPVTVVLKGCKSLMAVDGMQTNNNVHCEVFLIEKDGRPRGQKFKTKSIKATVNPMYNLRCDFGPTAIHDIGGLVVSIKHTASLGLKGCDLGEVVLTPTDIFDMKLKPDEWYDVVATPEMAQKGWSNRPLGQVRVGLEQAAVAAGDLDRPTSTSIDDVPAPLPAFMTSTRFIPKLSSRGYSMADVHHDPKLELSSLKKLADKYPQRGETWYAISSAWVMQWLSFVTDISNNALFPGEISNMDLINDELSGTGLLQIREDIKIIQDFRLVDPNTWKLFKDWYGGGPTITVCIPDEIPSVSGWMKSMALSSEGQIEAA
ncbi:hypothetical protein LEN26_010270 [Aphanomyces euteiches]|nr:hypothetical protein LEN26_010270 [Aphanomyces euteiches]KAH9127248.1 hypothetical protein AeMF1_002426 [Aphanomyces euteiches]KAH9188943.1 hypothetical protein AeNC1_009079 [Aphanomyces euteiches]